MIKITNAENDKLQLETKIRKIGNSKGIILPQPVLEHNNLELGDKVKIQAEYSDQYEEYSSFWNHTKQEGEQ